MTSKLKYADTCQLKGEPTVEICKRKAFSEIPTDF